MRQLLESYCPQLHRPYQLLEIRKILTPRIVDRPALNMRPSRPGADSQPVMIRFRAREKNSEWRTAHTLQVNPSNPEEVEQVEQVAKKDARNRQATFYNKDLRKLTPAQCFKAAIEDESNTILMQYGGELPMDENTMRAIEQELEL
ncbi:hypothetical protein BJX70DRAFT_407207 [Aspergillus crustosus]